MSADRGKRAASRAVTVRPFEDFNDNPKPVAARAAGTVTPEALATLFEQLDRADEIFAADGTSQRAASLAALRAVVEFLAASPLNGNGRFSRPLELLHTELAWRPRAPGGRILPAAGGGAGGVNSRPSDLHVRAAAAYAADFLHGPGGQSLAVAAAEVADVLDARGFRYGARRGRDGANHPGSKADAVRAWRRDYRLSKGRAARHYIAHHATPPVVTSGDAGADSAAVRAWLDALLARAGYGAAA